MMSLTAQPPASDAPRSGGGTAAHLLSRVMLALAVAVLVVSYLLMSPPEGQRYPGAIPWSQGSWLKGTVDALSLFGAAHTARGVEIKSLVFEFAVAAALLLAALRLWLSEPPGLRRSWLRGWPVAAVGLGLWVLISAASAFWSGDPPSSLTQAGLYGFGVAWAVSLGLTLRARDARRVLIGLAIVAGLSAALCIAYYKIRNPYHRPGFPLGNPSILAAALLPALLISAGLLGAAVAMLRRAPASSVWRLAAAASLLVLVGVAFALAQSRATIVGLLVALGGLLLARTPPRRRVAAAIGLAAVLAATGWYLWSARESLIMARGPSIRFRLYAWKYAALLWWQRPISGMGAGAFPRLAGAYSVQDRVLDPAAFMAELVEHAHNELFEVLTEIGLVGGVVFLAAWLAVLTTAMQTTARPARDRWLRLALAASLTGLMADAMFGVALRLPGVPAVFYTLIGVLWAIAREDEAGSPADHAVPLRRGVLAGGLLTVACLMALLAWIDTRAVRVEYASLRALQQGAYLQARDEADEAARLLLDPVRRLAARERSVRARYAAAAEALARFRQPRRGATQPAAREEARQRAIRLAQDAYTAAAELSGHAPALGYLASYGARLAEMLAELYADIDRQRSQFWLATAHRNWRIHRQKRPFDPQALLALTHYPGLLVDHLGMMRDALRAGLPSPAWRTRLHEMARNRSFARLIDELLASVGPYGPDTDADTLMLVRVPETLRLGAYAMVELGRFERAVELARRAAGLYQPLTPRVPTLRAAALAEAGEFALPADPRDPDRAIRFLSAALDALPPIQVQQRQRLAWPIRERLAAALLAAGHVDDAMRTLQQAGGAVPLERVLADAYVRAAVWLLAVPHERRPDVSRLLDGALALVPDQLEAWAARAWLAAEAGDLPRFRATLQQAAAAGIDPSGLQRIVDRVCQDFGTFCERLHAATRPAGTTVPEGTP